MKAILLACGTEPLTEKLVDEIEENISIFLKWYEKEVYQYKWLQLGAMRSMVHALAHVSESIHDNSPMRSFWEAPCEQLVGLMTEWIGSRTQANQNLANIIHCREQKNHLIYCVKLPEVTEKDMDLSPRKRYLREVKRKYQEWLQEKCGESASQCGKRTEDEYDSDLDSIMEERGVCI